MIKWHIAGVPALRILAGGALLLAVALEALGVVPQGVLAACREALRPFVL